LAEVAEKLYRFEKVCAATRPAGVKTRQDVSTGSRNRRGIGVGVFISRGTDGEAHNVRATKILPRSEAGNRQFGLLQFGRVA
jgi:hypothetical protein